MYQFMMWLWIFDAIINFINFFVGGYDFFLVYLLANPLKKCYNNE